MGPDQTKRWLRFAALPAALCAAAQPALAAPETADGRAIVVRPLSLVKTRDLSFGDLISGPAAGTVVVNEVSGARNVTGGVTAVGGTVSPASFVGAASRFSLVFIQQPATPVVLTRVGGTQTMRVSALAVQAPRLFLVGGRQAFEFNVGGTLQVGANQLDGSYVGTFNVTVNYF